MTSSAEGPGTSSDPPANPMDASRRYASPNRKIIPPGSQLPAAPTGSDSHSPGSAWSTNPRLPMILGIAGIVGWFLCGVGAIGSIIVGRIGQRKARELGQSDLLPKIAWIGGIVTIVGDVIVFVLYNPGS